MEGPTSFPAGSGSPMTHHVLLIEEVVSSWVKQNQIEAVEKEEILKSFQAQWISTTLQWAKMPEVYLHLLCCISKNRNINFKLQEIKQKCKLPTLLRNHLDEIAALQPPSSQPHETFQSTLDDNFPIGIKVCEFPTCACCSFLICMLHFSLRRKFCKSFLAVTNIFTLWLLRERLLSPGETTLGSSMRVIGLSSCYTSWI